jgi:hypothetical protein
MNKIGKYEFTNESTAKSKIAALGTATDEDGNTYPTHKHCIVELGNIVITPGDYDEEGNELKAPVLSEKYHVDVLWKGLEPVDAEAEVLSYVEPSGWENNRIELDNNGVHSFMGLDYQEYKF